LDGTTTTDSLGIVTLTMAAFKRGQLSKADLQAINEVADAFTDVLILANKYREVTGQSLSLDEVPSKGGAPQFDLPLAFLAPGEYGIEVKVTSPTGVARQLIRFRLVG